MGISLYDEYEANTKIKFDNVGFNVGVEFLLGRYDGSGLPDGYYPIRLSLKAHTINFKYLFLGVGVAAVKKSPSKPSEPKPKPHPTITPEELLKVELAYAQTVQSIERRGTPSCRITAYMKYRRRKLSGRQEMSRTSS